MFKRRKLYRFKPFFKKFCFLRTNIHNKQKLLKFKKQKWKVLKTQYEKKLRFFRKYKAIAQTSYVTPKFAKKNNSYKKRYRNTHNAVKSFKVFYGNLRKKQIKNKIAQTLKNQKKLKSEKLFLSFLKHFERRLDVVLVRASFCSTIRFAQQIIKHKKVKVNNYVIRNKAYLLNPGDHIKIRNCFKHQLNHICKDKAIQEYYWPHPPKYLYINYKTLQIIFGTISQHDPSLLFNVNLKLEKILLNFLKT